MGGFPVGTVLGRGIAMAFMSDDVDQDRPLHLFDVFEHRNQNVEVMAINRPDIIEAKFFE